MCDWSDTVTKHTAIQTARPVSVPRAPSRLRKQGSIRGSNNLMKSSAPKVEMSRAEIKDKHVRHLKEFIANWNSMALSNGREKLLLEDLPSDPIELHYWLAPYLNKAQVKTLAENMDSPAEKSVKGYALFLEKIDAIQRTILALEDDNWKHVDVDAPTQWGKTIVLIMALLAYIQRLHTRFGDGKQKEVAILFNVLRNNVANQTNDDFDACRAIYGPLRFRTGNRQVYDFAQSLDECHSAMAQQNETNLPSIKKSNSKSKSDPDRTKWDDMVEYAKTRGIERITVFSDEGDEATSANGVVASMLKKSGVKIRIALFTATNYAYGNLRNFNHVRIEVGENEGYSGTVHGKRTPVIGMSGAAEQWEVPDLAAVRPNLFNNAGSFRRAQSDTRGRKFKCEQDGDVFDDPLEVILQMTHPQYQAFCVDVVTTLMSRVVTNRTAKDAPIFPHGPLNGGHGILLRFGKSVKNMENLLKKIEPALRKMNVGVVRYYEKHSAKSSLADKVAEVTAKYPFYLLAIVGAGRRGDRIPRETTLGFDFTEEFSTMTAAEQGTLGRLSGWFKITPTQSTTVLLSDANYQMVETFRNIYDISKRKIPLGLKAASNTVKTARILPMTSERFRIDFGASDDPLLKKIEAEINRIISPTLVDDVGPGTKYGTPRSRAAAEVVARENPEVKVDLSGRAPKYYFPLFSSILPEKVTRKLEEHYAENVFGELKFQRPPAPGFLSHPSDSGCIALTFGNKDRGQNSEGGKLAGRTRHAPRIQSGYLDTLQDKHRPELLFRWNTQTRSMDIQCMVLSLQSAVVRLEGEIDGFEIFVNEKSMFWDHMDEDERRKSRAASLKK